ncbi:MAG: DUF1420 family protein [Saprospiraceae bacterium]|nr:DUF1420 family protein [Saprospiraceae bacterium]
MEAARFMMTAFLLMNLSLLFSTKLYAFPFIKMVLITQLTINFILICSLLYSTLPANFFKSYRIKCLQDKAYTFSLYRWMDTLSLPAESVVVPSLRAHLFINQNYVPYETRYFDSSPILSGKSTYYLFDTLSSTAGILIDSTSYKLATRNIFNQRTSKAFLYKVAD